MSTTYADHLVVIPCAAEKLDRKAPAVELYDSPNFRHTLGMACAHALDTARELDVTTKVMILSAKHGLVELGDVIDPYDTKMGQDGCVTVTELVDQLFAMAPQVIESFLPNGYRVALQAAVEAINHGEDDDAPWIALHDVYEAAPGIGFQRGVVSSLNRTMGATA
jgi:hypothetical protein